MKQIDPVIRILKKEARRWTLPAVGNYADTPFTVLISCLLSLRTQDKTTDAASARLFALAERPADMLHLSAAKIEKAIYPVGFYRTKARCILQICKILLEKYGGRVPDEIDALLTLPGVGRKTANVVLGVAFGTPEGVVVDTHVQRISQRLAFTRHPDPIEIEQDLMRLFDRTLWDPLSHTLIFHGRRLCTARKPACAACPAQALCPSAFHAEQVGRKVR